jgi:hypothetical protein
MASNLIQSIPNQPLTRLGINLFLVELNGKRKVLLIYLALDETYMRLNVEILCMGLIWIETLGISRCIRDACMCHATVLIESIICLRLLYYHMQRFFFDVFKRSSQ